MSFLSKISGWFGKKEKQSTPKSEWEQKREAYNKVFTAQAGPYEARAKEAQAILAQGPEAIAQATRSNVTKLVPKAEQERLKLAEIVTAYINRDDDPIMNLLKRFTGVEEVDKDYLIRIKHDLLHRPESFKDMTCFALDDYLHAVHTPYDEVRGKADVILNKAYKEMTGVPEVEVAEAEEWEFAGTA